jgi:diguanylate cyclase (GGDEF)-like protein
MTVYNTPQLSVGDIAEAIGTLRQLSHQIEGVRQDFLTEGDGPQLPAEVTQLHLRREMTALERQIRETLIHTFGEHSRQARQFRESGFAAATAGRLKEGLVHLDGFIFDLEQTRLHLLEANGSPPVPGIDPMTDLYTEPMLRRYLEHEVAWSQRHGDPFGLLFVRLPHWSVFKERYAPSIAKELVISMACILKTSLRGYDFPSRLKDMEFAAVLRGTNGLGVNVVTQRMKGNCDAAIKHLLPGVVVPLEYCSAIYPYDAESIETLFSYAADHWARL